MRHRLAEYQPTLQRTAAAGQHLRIGGKKSLSLLAVAATAVSVAGVVLTSGVASAAVAPLTLTPAQAAARIPGTPVAPIKQIDQSVNGGTNGKVGTVASTTAIGTPNAGVVPVIGSVAAVGDDGAYVAYESSLDARTLDLMVSSPGLLGATPVRLFLPAGYSSSSATTYSTLYLLGGSSEKADYQAWSLYTDVLSFASSKNVIVAMPSVGATGVGSNWYNKGTGAAGGFQWDTYLASELPQLLQRGYHASTKQAVVGVSTGGLTAMQLATAHPGAYGAVASFSGLDYLTDGITSVQASLVREGKDGDAPWGSSILNNNIWRANDPGLHVSALTNTQVVVTNGNGFQGPLDKSSFLSFLNYDILEAATNGNSQDFVKQLAKGHIPVTTDFYGSGTHSWPYWSRELQRSWPFLAAGLGV